jgi:hypothetical protein
MTISADGNRADAAPGEPRGGLARVIITGHGRRRPANRTGGAAHGRPVWVGHRRGMLIAPLLQRHQPLEETLRLVRGYMSNT